ncbi:MAG: hypothetical protein U0518_01105 [Candidatus Gracilibacteria bacterium]
MRYSHQIALILGLFLSGIAFFQTIPPTEANDSAIQGSIISCYNSTEPAAIKEYYCPSEKSNIDELIYYVVVTSKQHDIEEQIKKDLKGIMNSATSNHTLLSARISAMFDAIPLEDKYPSDRANYRDLLLGTCDQQNNLLDIIRITNNQAFQVAFANATKVILPPMDTTSRALKAKDGDTGIFKTCKNDMQLRILAYRDIGLTLAYERMALEKEKTRNEYFTKVNASYEDLLNKVNFYAGTVARIIAKFPNYTPVTVPPQ